ncbi:hypothetical protein PproGo58_16930 [Pseudomonas protegens]|nr:hypothetical protein PproGo58_16930 [Pseudomonas protegens]
MGEGNAVNPYKTDPFSAQLPCGQQTQKEAASLPNLQDERTGAMRIF